MSEVQVEDVMGHKTTKAAVNDWSFFRVSGRGTSELFIWPTVANPLTAATALDNVLLGIDEDANILGNRATRRRRRARRAPRA